MPTRTITHFLILLLGHDLKNSGINTLGNHGIFRKIQEVTPRKLRFSCPISIATFNDACNRLETAYHQKSPATARQLAVASLAALGLRRQLQSDCALPEILEEFTLAQSRRLAFAILLLSSTSASASSFVATTDTLGSALAGSAEATSDATSSLRDSKVVHAAQDDAASFVASNGKLRGARLEAALRYLRSQSPDLHSASDLQLAGAILSR